MTSPYGASFDGAAWPWEVSSAFAGWFALVDAKGRYVSDACVEGDAEQMTALAAALRAGTNYHAKRCAAMLVDDAYHLWSPRNTVGGYATLPRERAGQLADVIDAAIAAAPQEGA